MILHKLEYIGSIIYKSIVINFVTLVQNSITNQKASETMFFSKKYFYSIIHLNDEKLLKTLILCLLPRVQCISQLQSNKT